ncbi:MAG: M23 family metallopeptidase [Parvibaculum sp.]|jgi:biotin carboxyl carrier protein|uniref:M23 family metallopeptidase n=1 Tax=Parvibaculum sp. TaxID=2024848 RepID=UPI000CC57B16|nr:M23 family metallopeptidase [Parvibaculum sp.]MDZ4382285.1 M23 family metallopeptidase [Parvibaculum sp.]PKP77198.1 MAG: peptidase M23 [Alphaproteobacteria bacterium HGW-Alphaproteobacteria-3]
MRARKRLFGFLASFFLLSFPAAAGTLEISGNMVQGGLAIGRTAPGAEVSLDGMMLDVDADGIFAVGFDRDQKPAAKLRISYPDGTAAEHELVIAPREWQIQRVEGVPQKYVSPPPEAMAAIARATKLKEEARKTRAGGSRFAEGFIWPATGPISGVFGSQRYYNGEPRRPHYGVDVAAPTGTPIRAPAGGVVTLAEPDMYFEGGLVFLDHGQGVTTLTMHMSRVDVKKGDRVEQGDVIGAVGGTGRATGPHLHWGMYWRGAWLDPQLLVGPMPKKTDATGGN